MKKSVNDTQNPVYRPYTDSQQKIGFDTNELKQVYDLERLIPVFNGDPSELYQFLNITEELVNRFKLSGPNYITRHNQLHTLCMNIRPNRNRKFYIPLLQLNFSELNHIEIRTDHLDDNLKLQ